MSADPLRNHLVDFASPVLPLLILAAVGYAYAFYHFHHRGWLLRLRRRRLIHPWQPWSYAVGLAILFAALLSPIHDLAEQYLSMHMVQHILIMMFAPLLLLFGLPSPILRWLVLKTGLRRPLAALTQPILAFMLFNANLLIWHVPRFYQATLTNELVHDLQHALFFYTSLFFYWRLVDPTRGWFPFYDWAPSRWIYLMVAAPPSYILGSILWASNTVYYPYYAAQIDRAQFASPGGPTALQDQSFAGMIMWLQGWMFVMASMAIFFMQYEPGREQAQE
jgi:cytochrome c oxidase assembly factor CtaG